MQPCAIAEMLFIRESAGVSFHLFHEPVRPFGSGVGDAELEESEDLGPPGLHGLGQCGHLGQAARATSRITSTVGGRWRSAAGRRGRRRRPAGARSCSLAIRAARSWFAPIVVDAAVPHMRERLVRQAFPRAQQQPPVTKVESGVAEPVPDVHHLAGVPGWHRVPVGAKRDQGLV
jgi:hypothetical protein